MLYFSSNGNYTDVGLGEIITAVCMVVAVLVALYVLRSIGLYKMAENRGIEKSWLSFIPCAWIFIAGKIIGTARVFGRPFKKFALVTFIVYTVANVIAITDFLLSVIPLVGFYFSGGEIIIGDVVVGSGICNYPLLSGVYTGDVIVWKTNSGAVINYFYDESFLTIYSYLVGSLQSIVELASTFFMIILYAEIFKKYYPRRYFLFTVLSLFGGFSVIVFVLRNRKPINYSDYMREQYARMYSAGYNNPYNNPYGNPYGSANTQEQNEEQNKTNEPEEPFGEFSKKGDKDN